jgi:hypothetical protein
MSHDGWDRKPAVTGAGITADKAYTPTNSETVTAKEAVQYFRKLSADGERFAQMVDNAPSRKRLLREIAMCNLAADAIESGNDGWTPAENKPVEDGLYFICIDGAYVTYAHWFGDMRGGTWIQSVGPVENVTHYRPYPKRPEVRRD